MAKEGEYAATFDLDAAYVFNEASLINVVRFNVLIKPRLICWKQRIRDCGLPVDICIYAYLCCTSKGGIYASL
jgi:hypothetical protein